MSRDAHAERSARASRLNVWGLRVVIAYHFVFTTYGFWLPNDPRGSGSDYVGMRDLHEVYGAATKVVGERSVAHRPHDRRARLDAKKMLPRSPVRLSGIQAREAARGIGDYAARSNLLIYAFAIMPTHVHVVTSTHRLPAEQLLVQFKGSATRQMRDSGLWESPEKPWSRGGRHRFVDDKFHLDRAIRYVQSNPAKDGLPAQRWVFVSPVPS